jgi:hypothetical protein
MTLIEAGLVSRDGEARTPCSCGVRAARWPRVGGRGGEVEPDRPGSARAEVPLAPPSHTAGLPEGPGTAADGRFASNRPSTRSSTRCAGSPSLAPGSQLLYIQRRLRRPHPARRARHRPGVLGVARSACSSDGLTNTIADRAPSSRRGSPSSRTRQSRTPIESYKQPYWRQLAIPWGGLYGTPRDLVRVAAAFLPAEDPTPPLGGRRRLMTTDHARGVAGGVGAPAFTGNRREWGLGWEVKGEKRRHWTGDLTSPDTVCHFGQAGTLLWADPAHDLALAVFANRSVARTWGLRPPRWARLSNAVSSPRRRLECRRRRAEVGT